MLKPKLQSLSKMGKVLDACDLSKSEQDNGHLNNNLNRKKNNLNRSLTGNEIEAVIKIGRRS